ncbi:MAG: SHOCT domain-containing protein [Deltaproteobacteria bacterium]|nr:SHOCT domain-containing protein [Deltaproteobacteria bacterium]
MGSEKKKGRKFFQSDTWTGYSIIAIHLVFVIVLATSLIFIQALADYIEYVIAGGALFLLASLLFFYRKFRKNGQQLVETLQQSSSRYGQNIKIDLLGGLASISINSQDQSQNFDSQHQLPLAEKGNNGTVQALPATAVTEKSGDTRNELLRLAELYDRKLINQEEFNLFKKALLTSCREEQTPTPPV